MITRNKKGALELSIGTIVVIVLAMSMLILGLVLVRTIFTGAKYNVDQLNKNVEGEINKLFNEQNTKIVFYLPNREADIKKGDSYGVAFGIKNTVEGEANAGQFSYSIKTGSIQKGCQLTESQADSYLVLRDTGSFKLSAGSEPYINIVKVQPSSSAPLCEISYDLEVLKDGQPYANDFFIVKITG